MFYYRRNFWTINLPIVRKERRFIQTFEDKNVEPRILNIVQAKIKSVHNCKFVNIELFVVPKICSPIANQKVKVAKTTYKHLANLTLAENSTTNENLNIDILIGKFFNGNVINADEGPVAMETCLGWVLSGRATTDYTNSSTVENVFKITTAQIDITPDLI